MPNPVLFDGFSEATGGRRGRRARSGSPPLALITTRKPPISGLDPVHLTDLRTLPPGAARICARLLALAPKPAEELRTAVSTYLAEVSARADSGAFVDLALAKQIAAVLAALLRPVSLNATNHQAVQLAALYFTESKDSEPDVDSVLGFEDDAHVLNAVLRYLGRDDLLIPLP